eukprot:1281036-Rhodomonas_salina.1
MAPSFQCQILASHTNRRTDRSTLHITLPDRKHRQTLHLFDPHSSLNIVPDLISLEDPASELRDLHAKAQVLGDEVVEERRVGVASDHNANQRILLDLVSDKGPGGIDLVTAVAAAPSAPDNTSHRKTAKNKRWVGGLKPR